MTTVPVTYAIDAKGFSEVQRQIAGIGDAFDRGSTHSNKLGERINFVADSIKVVGKDLDNLGGDGAKKLAMVAEGAVSVAGALASGGVAGAIGLATIALTALSGHWSDTEKAAKEAAKQAEDAAKQHKAFVDSLVDGIGKMRQQVNMQSVLAEEDALQARRLLNMQRSLELVQIETARRTGSFSERIQAEKDYARVSGEITRENEAVKREAADVTARKNKLLSREVAEALASEGAAAAAAVDKRTADEKRAAEERQKAVDDAASAAARRIAWENEMAAKGTRARYEAERRIVEEGEKAKADAAKKAAEDQEKAQEQVRRAEEKRTEAIRRQREAIEQRTEAERINIINTQASAAASISYGVAMTVVTPIVNEFTGALRQLGDVNRDNYRDFLIEAEQLPAIIARKAQAIMAGIAAEATGKAIFETGEGLRETALGLGLIAIPGMQGQAAGHFASAGTHFLAANAYGVLGTGAAVGAVGVGAMRGDSAGSLIGLTKEEREKRDRDRGGGGGGGSLGGSSNSRGRNDAGQTVVNVNMEFGAYAIVPDNPRRIARAFAMGERAARRDGFARLNG